MRRRALIAVAAVAALAVQASAWAGTYDFSFTGSGFGGTSTSSVTGMLNLSGPGTGLAASNIFINSDSIGIAAGTNLSGWTVVSDVFKVNASGTITSALLILDNPADFHQLLDLDYHASAPLNSNFYALTGDHNAVINTGRSPFTAAPVPLPAPVTLLGSALLGLLVVARRRGKERVDTEGLYSAAA